MGKLKKITKGLHQAKRRNSSPHYQVRLDFYQEHREVV